MLDRPETYQVGVTVWWRGPEWAFAVPQGDLETIELVMARCSSFWNGINALIVPIDRRGRTWPLVEQLLRTRPVETCFILPGIEQPAVNRVAERLDSRVASWSTFREGFDRHEIHPLFLQPSYHGDGDPPRLEIPSVHAGARMRRILAACWGTVPDADRPHYERAFDVQETAGRAGVAALVAGQTTRRSPLELTARLMRPYGVNPPFERVVRILDRGSFNELVNFWNLRSRIRDFDGTPLLVGAPLEVADHPEALEALRGWVDRSFSTVDPDLGLSVRPPHWPRFDDALSRLGFERSDGTTVRRSFGARDDRPLRYGYFDARAGGATQRGAVTHEQVTVVGDRVRLRPPRPDGLDRRAANRLRLAVDGLPLAMPLSPQVASAMMVNAYRSPEGMTVITDPHAADATFELSVPSPWKALQGWAAEHGRAVAVSPDGRYGQAVLDRLDSLADLDLLADRDVLATLDALKPLSREKLSQEVVGQALRAGVGLDVHELAERIRDHSSFLEIDGRTVTEIGGNAGLRKPPVLKALVELLRRGMVRRGLEARCPTCGFVELLMLRELEERIVCEACRQEYLLPATVPGGAQESPWRYRLDGLMARAMDQDLLPVLLTARKLRDHLSGEPRGLWPGVELLRDGAEQPDEVDLVMSDGDRVWMAECKANASTASTRQLERLIGVAEQCNARFAFGAVTGALTPDQTALVDAVDGVVLVGPELLA